MSAFFNISSLFLGFLSLFLPLLSMSSKKLPIHPSGISFFCCALALLMQLAEVNHRVAIGDLAAVIDTICAVTLAGAGMIVICAIINLVVFLRCKK